MSRLALNYPCSENLIKTAMFFFFFNWHQSGVALISSANVYEEPIISETKINVPSNCCSVPEDPSSLLLLLSLFFVPPFSSSVLFIYFRVCVFSLFFAPATGPAGDEVRSPFSPAIYTHFRGILFSITFLFIHGVTLPTDKSTRAALGEWCAVLPSLWRFSTSIGSSLRPSTGEKRSYNHRHYYSYRHPIPTPCFEQYISLSANLSTIFSRSRNPIQLLHMTLQLDFYCNFIPCVIIYCNKFAMDRYEGICSSYTVLCTILAMKWKVAR